MSIHDDVIEFRKRLVAVIETSPNKRAACQQAQIHHSTFYRWRHQLQQPQPPVRRVSFRDQLVERRIVATALANPEAGPQRVADHLAHDHDLVVSASKVWRVLCRHRLNTRQLRYALLEQHRIGPPPSIVVAPTRDRYVGSLKAEVPGDLVQMDCFHVGSFKETRHGASKNHKGHIWQYTAIDVASSWLWAELHATDHNPSPALTTQLAHQVAADLTNWGWSWNTVSTDNGNEYRATQFRDTIASLGVEHRFIRAGRPQSNGKVERVQGTLLEELYQPALLGYVEPSITGLRRDLTTYLTYYNYHRPHRGKWNQGQPPATIIHPNPKLTP